MLVRFFKQHRSPKPFKFFNHWGQREDFLGLVRDIWNTCNLRPNYYRIIQNLNAVRALYKYKFKKDEQAEVVQAELKLLKAQDEVHSNPHNMHLLDVECNRVAILKKAKEDRDFAIR